MLTSSVKFNDIPIHLREKAQGIPQLSITEISLNITYLQISFKSPRGQSVSNQMDYNMEISQ